VPGFKASRKERAREEVDHLELPDCSVLSRHILKSRKVRGDEVTAAFLQHFIGGERSELNFVAAVQPVAFVGCLYSSM